MTTHELARLLLAGPDHEVLVFDEAGELESPKLSRAPDHTIIEAE